MPLADNINHMHLPLGVSVCIGSRKNAPSVVLGEWSPRSGGFHARTYDRLTLNSTVSPYSYDLQIVVTAQGVAEGYWNTYRHNYRGRFTLNRQRSLLLEHNLFMTHYGRPTCS